ncbi:MAG: hypothetical protein WDO74_26665 [Pseudomonadota bacterium]
MTALTAFGAVGEGGDGEAQPASVANNASSYENDRRRSAKSFDIDRQPSRLTAQRYSKKCSSALL